jgi:dTDP-4-dehydrorhamnose 3,5-epimerase
MPYAQRRHTRVVVNMSMRAVIHFLPRTTVRGGLPPGSDQTGSVELTTHGANEITPAAVADKPSVDAEGRRREVGIAGVRLDMLGPLQADHRGSLLEVVDVRDPFWQEPIVYAYRISIRPGRIKGWGMHKIQSDRYLTLAGRLRVVLYDGRVDSPSYGGYAEFQFTDETPGVLLIPPGVWHADQNTGDEDAVLVNFPTRAYDPDRPDKYRIDIDGGQIPFDWSLKNY